MSEDYGKLATPDQGRPIKKPVFAGVSGSTPERLRAILGQ
jgi:hypothetical protein